MKSSKQNIIVIAILILQTIASIVVFIFLFQSIADPASAFNKNVQESIKSYASNFKPMSFVGPQGEKGDSGADGLSIQGPRGDRGDVGEKGADGISIQGSKGDKGDIGSQGVQGEKGDPGPRAEFRCNADTSQLEYMYSGDEDWTSTGGKCEPVGENSD